MFRFITFLFISFFISGCTINTPKPSKDAVLDFDSSKFAGSWNQIGSIDKDEKNYKFITWDFSFDKEVHIVKRFVDAGSNINLKESFNAEFRDKKVANFVIKNGIFKQKLDIVKIDPFYEYALIFSKDKLWIISKKTAIPELIKVLYLDYAKLKGYDVSKIKWNVVK